MTASAIFAAGLSDGAPRGIHNEQSPPLAEFRRRRIAILQEYAERYKTQIAGWWFGGMELDSYKDKPDDWATIDSMFTGLFKQDK